jgi:hypothetical protein
MRLDYSRAEKLKVRGEWIDRRPAEQCSCAEKADDKKRARYQDSARLHKQRQSRIYTSGKQQNADERVCN